MKQERIQARGLRDWKTVGCWCFFILFLCLRNNFSCSVRMFWALKCFRTLGPAWPFGFLCIKNWCTEVTPVFVLWVHSCSSWCVALVWGKSGYVLTCLSAYQYKDCINNMDITLPDWGYGRCRRVKKREHFSDWLVIDDQHWSNVRN